MIDSVSYSSLFVEMYFEGKLLANATAFIAKRNERYFLLTNWHNVTGRDPNTQKCLNKQASVPDEIKVFYNKMGSLGEYEPITHPLQKDDKNTWFEHPTLKEKCDFVAFEIPRNDKISLEYFHKIEDSNHELDLKPSDIVSVVGFPFGKKSENNVAIWVTGFIATDIEINYQDLPMFLIDCRTKKGQSGSPVLLYRNRGVLPLKGYTWLPPSVYHEFLGIYSGRIPEISTLQASNENCIDCGKSIACECKKIPNTDIGMVWKKQAICELLDSI